MCERERESERERERKRERKEEIEMYSKETKRQAGSVEKK